MVFLHMERAGNTCKKIPANKLNVPGVLQFGHHDGELVPTQACDGVGLPHTTLHALHRVNQQHVAGVMTIEIVDLLEAVQINVQDRNLVPVTS
jgi:hypothetical protein